jgi:hypothetical protein
MTTSGTASFNLDLNDILEEAFERCGAEYARATTFVQQGALLTFCLQTGPTEALTSGQSSRVLSL